MRSKSDYPIILRVAGIDEGHLTYLVFSICPYSKTFFDFFHFMRSKYENPIIVYIANDKGCRLLNHTKQQEI